jgi:hypothetical protein
VVTFAGCTINTPLPESAVLPTTVGLFRMPRKLVGAWKLPVEPPVLELGTKVSVSVQSCPTV